MDQLKDYVQTSLSTSQNVASNVQDEDVEESEINLGDDYEYSLSILKLEERGDD